MNDQAFVDWQAHVFGFGHERGRAAIIPLLTRFMKLVDNDGFYNHSTLERFFGPDQTWLLINILGQAFVVELDLDESEMGYLTGRGTRLKRYLNGKTDEQLIALCRSTPADPFPDDLLALWEVPPTGCVLRQIAS